jgi:hypothetical protein
VDQGEGTLLVVGGGAVGGGVPVDVPVVVKDQVGDAATMVGSRGVALVRETTFQKYVVPVASAADEVHE